MAFPTSSLTNNQVHKEGNRAFVYDSTLGVWDQVRETDRTEGDMGLGSNFPSRHILQVQFAHSTASASGSGTDALAVAESKTLSSSSNLILAVATIAGKSYTSSGQTSIYTGMKMISSGTGVTAQTLQQTPQDGTGPYGIGITQLASNGILYGLWTSQFIFTPVLEGTVTISAYMDGYSSTSGLVITNENTSGSGRVDGGSTITLYEITP